MAQRRALRDGDVLQYEMVENKLLERPTVKGLALRSDSIENFELFKVNKMYESENLSIGDSDFLRDDAEDFGPGDGEARPKKRRKRHLKKDPPTG